MPIQKVGPYDIFGTIGKGQFCRVKFATNRDTKSSVAVKILDKIKLRDAALIEEMKSEITVMKRLRHNNCVGLHDMYANPTKIIVVLDLVMGISLLQIFKSKKLVPEDIARKYLAQLVSGLTYCHKQKIILGGLELGGVLVETDCSLKISDFGRAANVLESNAFPRTRKQTTLQYTAPEQLVEVTLRTPKADVWSLGVVMFAIVTGMMPFDTTAALTDITENIRTGNHKPFPENLSKPLCTLLDSILNIDVEERFTLAAVSAAHWSNITSSVSASCNTKMEPLMQMDEAPHFDKTTVDGYLCNVHIPFVEYLPNLNLADAFQSFNVFSASSATSCSDEFTYANELQDLNISIDEEAVETSSAFQEIEDIRNFSPFRSTEKRPFGFNVVMP